MSIQKYSRRLTRDLKSSPKKSALLGLLALAAIYFWAPLVWPEGDDAPSPAPAVGAATVAVESASSQPAAVNLAVQENLYSWSQIAASLDNDPLMATSTKILADRNPWLTDVAPAPDDGEEPENEVQQAALAPADRGLVLSSTVVGPRRRTALISGKSYREGQPVDGGDGVVFTLARVNVDRIVLERNGQTFELMLRPEKPPGRIELEMIEPR